MKFESASDKLEEYFNKESRKYNVLKVRSYLEEKTYEFFNIKGFKLVRIPVLNNYINKKSNNIKFKFKDKEFELNASGALYLGAYSCIYDKVFSIEPTFRDEKVDDKNHLIEFWMLEVEWLEDNFESMMMFIEEYLEYIVNSYNEFINKNDLKKIFEFKNINIPIKRIKYNDVINIMNENNINIKFGEDLSNYDNSFSKLINEPVFVINYPRKIASWTAKQLNNIEAKAFNLVLNGSAGELAEGCMRETDYRVYDFKFKQANLNEELNWYSYINKRNKKSRCGFGLGIDRLCKWITNCEDISDVLIFSKTAKDFR